MDAIRFPRSYKVYLTLLVVAAVLFLILPRNGKFNYDYRKGSPWMYETLVAQFDFPVLKTEEQIQQEVESNATETIPYFKKSGEVGKNALAKVSNADFGAYVDARESLLNEVGIIYEKGYVSSHDVQSISADGSIFVQKEKRAVKCPLSEVFTTSEVKDALCAAVKSACPNINADSLCLAAGIYDAIVPDLVFDQKTTDLIQYNSVSDISTTDGFIQKGTTIVSDGEIVTAEIQQLLDSYKVEYESSVGYKGNIAFLWLGNALIALLIVALLFFVILYTNRLIFEEMNRFLYIMLLFLLASVAALLVDRFGAQYLYMVPFSLIALYMLAFFKKRVVLPVYIISLLPLLIFAHNGVELFVMFLAAGIIDIYAFTYFNRGWLQFVNAFFSFAAMLFVWTIFQLIDGVAGLMDYKTLLYLFLGALFTVAGYPLIYLFEKMFGLISSSRLQELCDTNNNKLLVELSKKAPGTFQHSLQVMNMCDATASAIGANVLLVRAGAMYHDIGKIANPLCFVENSDGMRNYHEDLSPVESAEHIIRHVSDGLAIAAKSKLPSIIRAFINTHHGTTCTGYFYGQFIQQGGSPDSAEAKAFFYKGNKPQTKEQVILMICDSLEAASRSMDNKTQESLSALVDKIINGKVNDGQLENADITMSELRTINEVLKQYLLQVYHPRVAYPAPVQPAPAKQPEETVTGSRLLRRRHRR